MNQEELRQLITTVDANWKSAGLLKPSFVRPKIAAIEPSLIVHHVGKLSADDLSAVDACLRQAMNL